MMFRKLLLATVAACGLCLSACSERSGAPASGVIPASEPQSIFRREIAKPAELSTGTPITHVVIIIQENRSFENLFEGFPGANTQSYGYVGSTQYPLQPTRLVSTQQVEHGHPNWVTEYNNGAMNGWPLPTLEYVVQSDIEPYWELAQDYELADEMFQSDSGPSLPAHQYLISATSAVDDTGVLYVMGNPIGQGINSGGCASPANTLVPLINPITNDTSQTMFPCFDHPTLIDSLEDNAACNGTPCTWRYYTPFTGPSIWNGPGAIKHIWDNPALYDDVVTPNTKILTDISNGALPSVSWVIPTVPESDHSDGNQGLGPTWVSTVVNAIGKSQYWDSTAIFIVWDDWGGWYDHVAPPVYNYDENGFRVPLITVSAYGTQSGYISHVDHEFGSIIKFTEEVFGLPSLGYTDVRADDLSDMFNFNQTPTKFKAIPITKKLTEYDEYYTGPPDDDF
jgi:phospholipase C